MCAPTPAHKDLKGPVDKETESRPLLHAATAADLWRHLRIGITVRTQRHVYHDNNRLWMTISDKWFRPVLFFLYFVFRYNTSCVI